MVPTGLFFQFFFFFFFFFFWGGGGAVFTVEYKSNVYVFENKSPLWVRGCRIGPTYPPACRKRRLIGGSLFAVGCDPCQWKRGSWLLSQYFVAAYTALASISLSRKVKMAWLNQSAGSAKP